MISNFFLVGIGGFFGSIFRYLISILIKEMAPASLFFPWATLIANLLGCFLIGLLFGLLNRETANHLPYIQQEIGLKLNLLIGTGFLGGFTTFSTFNAEIIQLFTSSRELYAILYLLVSILFGLLLFSFGKSLTYP